jgi:broad-specificity NMP kinase
MQPSLILLRGLPGAGKTTLAKVLSESGKWPVFSVDDYFVDLLTGTYTFNHRENHLAYKACLQGAEKAMQTATAKIFIDNTLTIAWEIEPYFHLSAK